MTNVVGTVNLLNAAKDMWKDDKHVFHHVSTDEVYGSLGTEGLLPKKHLMIQEVHILPRRRPQIIL